MSYSIGKNKSTSCGNLDCNEFICIDFETANSKRQSICQVALIHFKNGEIIQEKEWFVKPPKNYREFNEFNIQIHGIRPEDVENDPEFNFICTCSVSRKTWDKQINYTLKNIANQLGYIFNHHDAHDDSHTCGKILLESMKYHESNTLSELSKKYICKLDMFQKAVIFHVVYSMAIKD